MSKYTMELRFVDEFIGHDKLLKFFTDYKLEDYLTPEQIQTIQKANLWTKEKLAEKIINHYYMNEIGQETIALFKHYCKVTMEELMEEYLPLIYSSSIEYDPMVNVDFTETFDRNINTSGSGTSNSQSNSTSISTNLGNGESKNSNTPMSALENLRSEKYVDNAQITKNQSDITDNTDTGVTSTQESTGENIEHYTRSQKGNSGSLTTAQNLVKQYRQNIIAIDREIINKLNNLFMQIY